MMWILWIVLGLIGLVALVVLVFALLGSRIPVDHTASCSARLKQPPEAVWPVLADAGSFPKWAAGVDSSERIEDRDGREAWRQKMGRLSFVLETTRSDPPRTLERTIKDDWGPFSGSWKYELRPDGVGGVGGQGCVVTLTERGHIPSAISRAVMKHFIGYHKYIVKHLESLGRKFDEVVEVRDKTVG